jgi:hypothetical protein
MPSIGVIDVLARFRRRLVKAVPFKSADMRLIVPVGRANSGCRPEIPQAEFRRPMSLAIDRPAGQPSFLLSGPLVKIAVDDRFESMRLVDHLRDGANSSEIGAIRPNPVDSDIADQQFPNRSFSFRFRTEQPSQQRHILVPRPDYRHFLTSRIRFIFRIWNDAEEDDNI